MGRSGGVSRPDPAVALVTGAKGFAPCSALATVGAGVGSSGAAVPSISEAADKTDPETGFGLNVVHPFNPCA